MDKKLLNDTIILKSHVSEYFLCSYRVVYTSVLYTFIVLNLDKKPWLDQRTNHAYFEFHCF